MTKLAYSTKHDDVAQLAEKFTTDLLGFSQTTEAIIPEAQLYPEEFILQLYCAIFYFYGQNAKSFTQASMFMQRASALLQHANERETILFNAVSLMLALDFQKAIDTLYELNQQYRSDLLAMKLAEFCFFCLGQAYEARQYLNYTQSFWNDHKKNQDFLSMYAFANHLAGNFDKARIHAEQALAIDPKAAWAHHCLTHVFIRKKLLDEGIDITREFLLSWPEKDKTIYSHNVWHLALLYLERLDLDNADNIQQQHLAKFDNELVSIDVDKISLLWRLEMAGKPQQQAWFDIADAAAEFAMDQFTPFLNAHFFYALARAGRKDELQQAFTKYKRHAEVQSGYYHRNWFIVGHKLLEAVVDFANENWQGCVDKLAPYINIIGCVGGSDAQVDLFKQTYLCALINAKHYHEANTMLYERANKFVFSPLESFWMEQIKL